MYSAVCRTSLRDRQRERLKQEANEQKRARWSVREIEIRDGIKHCETEHVNKTEQRKNSEDYVQKNSGRKLSEGKGRDENQKTIISRSLRCNHSNLRSAPESLCHSLKTRGKDWKKRRGERERECLPLL